MELKTKYNSEDEDSIEEEESDQEEMEEEEEEDDAIDSEKNIESADDEMPAGTGHPYPTPPPDAVASMSLGNGVTKIQIKSTKPKKEKNPKATMASSKMAPETEQAKLAKKESTINLAMTAIEALSNRNGTSVQAIVKYIKSTGLEVPDERRFSRLVLRALKTAVIKGDLTQVKRSFKLSEESKKKSKAVEKMKAKKEKQMEKEKQKEAAAKEKTELKKKRATKKPSERETKPSKKPTKPKQDTLAGNAKASAAAKAQAALDDSEMSAQEEEEEQQAQKPTKQKKATAKKAANPKVKTARKSIGTLAQIKGVHKVPAKSIKKLVGGKMNDDTDNVESAEYTDLAPNNSSTPINELKQKRKGRAIK